MKTTHRSFAEEAGDFSRLCRFAIENYDQLRAYSTWSLGRLVDWKYGLYENKQSIAGFVQGWYSSWSGSITDR